MVVEASFFFKLCFKTQRRIKDYVKDYVTAIFEIILSTMNIKKMIMEK